VTDILVIEDDESIREGMAALLRLEGYEVATAIDGKDGIDKVRGIRPGLILLDLMMPVMTGWEFLVEHLRHAESRRIPVVVISATPDVREHAASLGIAAWLEKPIDYEQLMNVVRSCCMPAGVLPVKATSAGNCGL